jgi:hypothetical protein
MATTRSTKREKRAPHRRLKDVRVKSLGPDRARNVRGGLTDPKLGGKTGGGGGKGL